ncbi:hypothetical protein MKS88_001550 [Plasmodium brasilianum]|uniref:Pv-fam-d protein n=2 Tax=Plasmodium (Plasmodium) TaxID=418103 RepID=A0A1D3JLT1_PLAMA|nr:Plasmodium exported protein, unknown function [Plasmodium malariae]KAI4840192.1 hypothetical protein MKS88_001550 [Plasmodium brasilianum]SBT87552.1 Plasmodium exported protein, unknown function [Plasmodium malariae]
MLVFFTKNILFSTLIWAWEYSCKLTTCSKSWNEVFYSNNTFNVRCSRLLYSETKLEQEKKYEMLKKRIYSLLDESDDAFGERLNALAHDDLFRKQFNKLVLREVSKKEINNLMQCKNHQKQHDACNFEHNIKKKSDTSKHYDNVVKHKNPTKLSKKASSKFKSDLFHINYINNVHSVKFRHIVEAFSYLKKKNKVLYAAMSIITVYALFMFFILIISVSILFYIFLISM